MGHQLLGEGRIGHERQLDPELLAFGVLSAAAEDAGRRLLAYAHAGGIRYETLLGAHILSAEALLVWFPFGKLIHAFTIFAARGATGLIFERKGASL